MLKVSHVSKSYGSGHALTEVLSDISMQISPGTFNVLLGRSGSGKSTLLNLISGLDFADEGNIEFRGQSINNLTAEELAEFRLRHIGLVFQFFNLLPTLSLYDNIALAGHLGELASKEIKKRVESAIEQVGLQQAVERMPHEASGGEIQRAAIARALINQPDIILADEPTGNLDLQNKEAVENIFHHLVKDEKKTVLIVTHDHSFEQNADQIFRLNQGRLI